MATSRKQHARTASPTYREERADIVRTIEQRVIGGEWGANGSTSVAQADEPADRLHLRRGDPSFDVGAAAAGPGCTCRRRWDARSP